MTEAFAPSPEIKPDPDLSGRRLGDYQLLRRLGRGGMAEVYLAEQHSLRRQIAFKVLKNSLAGDSAYVRRFHNEAQAAARLVHANIVQIYEVGCVEGVHYIAQEYVPGQNLKQLLARRGKGVDAPLAANILRQVAAALHKAGEQGIIHRDIKPENIMLSASGEVKVADFGLARVSREGEAADLTQIGITMGTPLYMSPEQVEGRAVDPRSDLYSLGVTSYQMLAGRPPFEGETALSIAIQHLKADPVRLEKVRPDLPGGLCRIVHKMLEKAPTDRFQKPVEVVRELRTLQLDGMGDDWQHDLAGWTTTEMVATSEARTAATQMLATLIHKPPPKSNRGWRWAALLIVLLAFPVGSVAAWLSRPQPLLSIQPGEVTRVERLATAEEQYLNALFAQTNIEQAWRAVADYHPPDDKHPENLLYIRQAAQRLAAYYLSQDQLDQALALYQDLTRVEETSATFRIVGLAGEAVVYDRRGRAAEVQTRLAKVYPSRGLLDDFLRGEVERLKEKYSPEGKAGARGKAESSPVDRRPA